MQVKISARDHKYTWAPEIFNGEQIQHADTPDRVENILDSLNEAGIEQTRVKLGEAISAAELEAAILRVHSSEYYNFLAATADLTIEENIYPSVFPYSQFSAILNSENIAGEVIKRGMYVFDTYTPLNAHSFEAAKDSALLAIAGAQSILAGERWVYSLCRPSGHHAERSKAGGYCLINNSAVAAEYLLSSQTKSCEGNLASGNKRGSNLASGNQHRNSYDQGVRIATLDIDFHHGNGTQGIFYERDDVFTASIHADPRLKFPYYTVFSAEIGVGVGTGYNLNVPLELGTQDPEYLSHLEYMLGKIADYNPNYLLISLGVDTHQADPISGFKLTGQFFSEAGKMIKNMGLPTLILQEGGYATEVIGANVLNFLTA